MFSDHLEGWGLGIGWRREAQEEGDKFLQSYLTICDPMDCSLPGLSIHEIFQASGHSVSTLETKQAPLLQNAEVPASLWATQAAEPQDPNPKLPQICHSPCSPI